MSRFLLVLSLAALGTAGGCSNSDKEDANVIPPPPSECESLPSLSEVRPKLVAFLDERSAGATVLQPENARLGAVPLSVGRALDGKDDETGMTLWRDGPLLLRSLAEVQANEYLASSADYFDVDWSKEALLIVREHPRRALYRYVLDGTELVVLVAKATPCLAPVESESFLPAADRGTRALKVPNTVLTARMDTSEWGYRVAYPVATGTCRRASEPAILGGGQPNVVRGPDGLRLYFAGFSAMTGNIFFSESSDGAGWPPNGWDAGHPSTFAGRDSHYANVYEPFVEYVDHAWRMTATTNDFEVVHDDKTSVEIGYTGLVEMTSTDGIAWSEGKALFPRTKSGERARTAPSRIVAGDEEQLYFAGDGEIRVARRRGGADFVEDPTPVLAPSDNLDTYDALGYSGPEVARVGGRVVLFATARWGGLSVKEPWRTTIAYAISDDDGATFRPGPAPLVVPEADDEAGGMGSPSALVTEKSVALFFSSVNRRSEPVVKRADCTVP